MAQWQELLRLDSALQGRVSQLYEGKVPLSIRQCLSVWIESQDWGLAAVDKKRASACFHSLLAYLDEQWNLSVKENNILQGPDFAGIKHHLQKHFEEEPVNLAIILSECLKEEKKIIDSTSDAHGRGVPAMEQRWRDLDNKVEELKRQIMEAKKQIKSLGVQNENLDFIQKTWQSNVEQRVGLAKSQAFVEDECQKRVNVITQTTQMMLQQMTNILNLAKQIVETLTAVELPEWKHRQQMACIGSPADTGLEHLQKWFTTVAEVLQQVLQELHKLQDQGKKYYNDASVLSQLPELEEITLFLYKELLCNALVVEKQPFMLSLPHRPLILKTRVRFTVILRFLANLPEFKCRLKVKAVVDKDVEEVKTIKGFRHFEFVGLNNSKVLDVDTPEGGLVAEFGHMSLQEKKEKSKGSAESRLTVTEELHVIKFVMEFQNFGQLFNIEASSLPVVVISSSNQVPSAWASVMWSNMLSTAEDKNLSLFVDPPPLPWQQLSEALSWQFLSVGKRELDEDQLSMLRDKIVDDPDELVPWQKFSKSEGFWVWIDGILDLIKKHLVDFWQAGSIMGFVSREKTRLLLRDKQTGTFLLRFSESIKDGAITFSWVHHSKGEHHVHAVEPYTKKELDIMTVPDIIYNYNLKIEGDTTRNPLLYLYPDIHKDIVFGPYYSSSEKKNGYVLRKLGSNSDNPTPPPSPPQEMIAMDMDVDMDPDAFVQNAIAHFEEEQLIQELFPGALLPGSPDFIHI